MWLWVTDAMQKPLLILHLVIILASYSLANWMYLGVVGVAPPLLTEQPADMGIAPKGHSICNSLPGLVSQQVEVCQRQPDVILSVSDGAKRGIQECQFQFRYERWNCTTQDSTSVFGYTIKRGSRETAFIYAVTSAGVVHAVTQACSSGNLTECTCDLSRQGHSTPEGWKWGGCSDNIQYGIHFSKRFVDAPEKAALKIKRKRKARNQMNLHNNQAGREAIMSLMRKQCRCHGVSGSCELKTCWKSIPKFSQVGDYLKEKYQKSVQMKRRKISKKKKRYSRSQKRKRRYPAQREDLVHIRKSPNYCVEDRKKGIPGTTGRICNKTSNGPDSCNMLCCGRGYNTQVVRKEERCHCKFQWCCYVTCKTCITVMDLHTCK